MIPLCNRIALEAASIQRRRTLRANLAMALGAAACSLGALLAVALGTLGGIALGCG